MFWNHLFGNKHQQEIARLDDQFKSIQALNSEYQQTNTELKQETAQLSLKYQQIKAEQDSLEKALISKEAVDAMVGHEHEALLKLAVFIINKLIDKERKLIPARGHYKTEQIRSGGHYETQKEECCGSSACQTIFWMESREVWVDDYVNGQVWVEDVPALPYYEETSLLNQAMIVIDRATDDYKNKLQMRLDLPLQDLRQMIANGNRKSTHEPE